MNREKALNEIIIVIQTDTYKDETKIDHINRIIKELA